MEVASWLLNGSWSSGHGITSRQEKGKEKNQECTSQLNQPHLFKAQRRLENVVFLVRKVWIQINDCFNKEGEGGYLCRKLAASTTLSD